MSELKFMMEKLGAPQTHLGLKAMMKEVDEDGDNEISFREFLLIFVKSANGSLSSDAFKSLISSCASIDVQETGVGGAKSFFEAKADKLKQSALNEAEIKREQVS